MGFIKELKKFFKINYYIFIVGILALLPILITQSLSSSIEVISIFLSHLTADIFMALMIMEFSKGNMLKGYIYQLGGSIVFLVIGLYSFIFHKDSIYLIPSLIYFPVVFKSIYEYKTNKKINILNEYIISLFGLILLLGTIYIYNITSIAVIIQFIGVLFFAVILNLKNPKLLNTGGIIMLIMMILGGLLKLYNEVFIESIINGATFSYTILPLVVLIGFIKERKNMK